MSATGASSDRPPAWAVLQAALTQRRPVRIGYHGHERVVCPHALGWKNGRAKALCYQTGGTTSTGPLPRDSTQRWRSLFIDQIHDPTIIDGPWETADNYTHHSNGIDQMDLTAEDHAADLN